MKKLFFVIMYLCIFNAEASGWVIKSRTDAMTDKVRKTAIVSNADGHTFSIYRISDNGAVWGNFALSEKSFDQVDWSRPPIYRIDKNEPHDMTSLKETGEITAGKIILYEWKPKWVNFQIWHGKKSDGIATGLRNLLTGKEIVFRYYLFSGGYKDTSFSLKGAGPIISKTIDVSEKEDPSEKSKVRFRSVTSEALNNCTNNPIDFKACFDKVTTCSKKANIDVDLFNDCIN